MTRKRFIKLLMATGRPRNDAVKIAEVVPKFGWSYAQVYRAVLEPIAQCAALAAELVDLLIAQPAVRAEGNEDRDLRAGRVALDPFEQERQHPLCLHRARKIAHQNAHVLLSHAHRIEWLCADGVIKVFVDARG